MSSVIGMLVAVLRTVSGSVREKSITRMNAVPLCMIVLVGENMSWVKRSRTYVTPPTMIDRTIALGASEVGRGISSVMCMTGENKASARNSSSA